MIEYKYVYSDFVYKFDIITIELTLSSINVLFLFF